MMSVPDFPPPMGALVLGVARGGGVTALRFQSTVKCPSMQSTAKVI